MIRLIDEGVRFRTPGAVLPSLEPNLKLSIRFYYKIGREVRSYSICLHDAGNIKINTHLQVSSFKASEVYSSSRALKLHLASKIAPSQS